MSAAWPSWLRRSKRYREKDFRRRDRFRSDYLALAGHLADLVDFESAYDVGCANGFLLEGFLDAGKEVAGIEASAAVGTVLPERLAHRVSIGDFAEASGNWDLVCCVEVAEHIEPHRSHDLVDTLCGLATRWIYFTAAPPGQSGRGHINCRPHEEWLGWFAEAGWRHARERTAALRERLETLSETPWLRANSYILGAAAPSE